MTKRIPIPILAVLLSAACTTQVQLVPDAGSSDGGNGVKDAGMPGCKVDLDCAPLHALCNVADGGCVLPPHPCDPSRAQHGGSQCNGVGVPNCTDPNNSSNFCFCRPDSTSDAGGYCYPQLKPCATCGSTIDCGAENSGVDNVGVCTTLDAPAGSSVCLRFEVGGSCDGPTGGGFEVGRAVDGGTLCECPSMTCPCGPCTADSDCGNPALGVCGREQGVCQAPCLPGLAQCPTVGGVHQVCHVMDKYLDPTLPLEFYGGGRCGPPCTSDSDCQSPYYATAGGVPLRCEQATHVCRPPIGQCIADFECTGFAHPDASVSPFCDVWAVGGATCNGANCRLGTDTHVADQPTPFVDCSASFGCLLPDGGPPSSLPTAGEPYGYGVCEPLPCYQTSPLFNYGCLENYLCCGVGDAGAANPSCALGECYYPPKNPWCTQCTAVGSSLDPACAGLTGFVEGPTFCTQERAGAAHCGVACDKHEQWTCPAGASCFDQGYPFTTSCPAGMTAVALTELDPTGTSPTFGCNCSGAKCPTTPIAPTGVTFDVASCAACPDPTPGTGCLPDNASPGKFACVCNLAAGGTDCAGISGTTTTTCVDLGAPNPAICEIGVAMVWDDKENAHVLGMNCTVRTCSDAGY